LGRRLSATGANYLLPAFSFRQKRSNIPTLTLQHKKHIILGVAGNVVNEYKKSFSSRGLRLKASAGMTRFSLMGEVSQQSEE